MSISIPRSIHFLDEKDTYRSGAARPLSIHGIDELCATDVPGFGRPVCMSVELWRDPHSGGLSHDRLNGWIWARGDDGSLARYDRLHSLYENDHVPAFNAPDLSIVPHVVRHIARSFRISEDQHVPVFYFPSCTIIMGVEVADFDAVLEARHPGHRHTPASNLVGAAYALPPASRHAELDLTRKIRADIATHTEILGMETGFDLETGNISVTWMTSP